MSGYFEDSNGNKSSSRLNQFIIVTGGIVLTGIALVMRLGDAAGLIFGASAAAAGAVGWNNRTQEAKEAIVASSQPDADVKTEVKA